MGYRTSNRDGHLDDLIETAKKREAEHGGDPMTAFRLTQKHVIDLARMTRQPTDASWRAMLAQIGEELGFDPEGAEQVDRYTIRARPVTR